MKLVYIFYSEVSLYYFLNNERFGFRTVSKETFENRLHELKCELLLKYGVDIMICPVDSAYKYDHLKAIIICDEQIIKRLKN